MRVLFLMMASTTAVAWLSLTLSAQPRLSATTMLPESIKGREPLGTLSGDSLVTIQNHSSASPTFRVYDKSGKQIQRIDLQIPGANVINVYNHVFARAADGSLAVSGSAYTADSRGTVFLAIIAPDGLKQVVIRTSPYVPYAVAFSQDGVIWTAGRELVDGMEANYDYPIIRRFDRTGRFLGGAIMRTSAPMTGGHPASRSYLIASTDRVGWFSALAHQYIELALDGRELRRYKHDITTPNSAAICDDNSVWVLSEESKNSDVTQWAVVSLDRAGGGWRTDMLQSRTMYLYGCSGTTLATNPGNAAHIEWLATR